MEVERLYREHNQHLIATLRRRVSPELAEDIAADTWLRILKRPDAWQFDSDRGSEFFYLLMLAKTTMRNAVRSASRRAKRETACRKQSVTMPDEPAELESFAATLSRAERRFYLREIGITPAEFSPTNEWQLRHRVRKKLESFIESRK